MTITETRRLLVDKLSNELKSDSFTWTAKSQYFIRRDDSKTQIIDLLFTKRGTTIEIEPTLKIKVKEIEDYYKPYFSRDSEYFSSIKTIGNNLFKIKKYYDNGLTTDPDEKSYYLIENPDDIVPTVNGLTNLVKTYGYRYFTDTSDTEKIDKLLNSNPKEISIHYSLYPMRAIMGVIAAFKTKSPNLNNLIAIYRSELVDAESLYKNEFDKIVNDM
jgi:hypothetical protein